MNISSRTPEGEPNRCPVCGGELQIEPSRPIGDAPCPHCGVLLSFPADPPAPQKEGIFRCEASVVQVPHEPARRLSSPIDSPWRVGDRIRVVGGMFDGYEGTVREVDLLMGRVTIEIIIFGRPTPLELEPSQCRTVP